MTLLLVGLVCFFVGVATGAAVLVTVLGAQAMGRLRTQLEEAPRRGKSS